MILLVMWSSSVLGDPRWPCKPRPAREEFEEVLSRGIQQVARARGRGFVEVGTPPQLVVQKAWRYEINQVASLRKPHMCDPQEHSCKEARLHSCLPESGLDVNFEGVSGCRSF